MPDDIRTHARTLLKPYVRQPDAEEKISSARILARLALENDQLYGAHRKKMLSDAIWYCTEADGKWATRYKSKEVWELARNEPTSLVRINHEHVVTRKGLIEQMLANDKVLLKDLPELHRLLGTAVGCIVTASEHAKLPNGSGWQRYSGIIDVYDTKESPPRLLELNVAEVIVAPGG